MIQKIDIKGVHTTVDQDLQKYLYKKIGRLDHYMPRHARPSVHAEIWLKESKAKDKKQFTCEVTMHMPHENISTKETTMNMYAAIDIVEAKLKQQLQKYKELHNSSKLHQKLLTRLKRNPLAE
jgi:ribosomal subunit interface protein